MSDPSLCMFCGGMLASTDAANLAFMAHIQMRPECAAAFTDWTEHMLEDWVGD
jgi:hypothetical protein